MTSAWMRLAWIAGVATLVGCADGPETEAEELEELAQALTQANCTKIADGGAGGSDAFYATPSATQMAGEPGTIIRCEDLGPDSRRVDYNAYRVMYRTTTVVQTNRGANQTVIPLPATGMVYVPNGKVLYLDGGVVPGASAPTTTRPVIANTHGLTGMRVGCGTSRGKAFDKDQVGALLGSVPNALVVVPDYVGLGVDTTGRTPDYQLQITASWWFEQIKPLSQITHPLISIEAQGRATIDLVRAARTLPAANTGTKPKWFAIGQSQGAHAGLAAAEVSARNYGVNDHQLLGVIAGAPASEFDRQDWEPELRRGIQSMAGAGLSLEFRDFSLSEFATNRALEAFHKSVNTKCADFFSQIVEFAQVEGMWKKDPFSDPRVAYALDYNSPGRKPAHVPVFLGLVKGDPLLPTHHVRPFVTSARRNYTAGVTYCEYPPITGPENLQPALLRAQNHNAFARMFDLKTCTDENDKPVTADPVSWAKAIYDKAK